MNDRNDNGLLRCRKSDDVEPQRLPMKISLGLNLQRGPWGGGNQFGRALADYLRQQGATVCFDLTSPDLDLILLAEPRSNLRSSAYTDRDVFRYLRSENPEAIVVHRVNECDERKNTNYVNSILRRANLCADYTVFVSDWLKNLHLEQGIACQTYGVIHNGSDRSIFHPTGYRPWDRKTPLRLVTHHWGASWMKGFDIYERLDRLLAADRYCQKVAFTYIGNLPEGFRFKNATYIAPLQGQALADALREHHVYLTASRNEPGSNHQNEGANCGLPLLYLKSGGLTEYCEGYGIAFTAETFEQKLDTMIATYDRWANRIQEFPHSSERMCQRYYNRFLKLLQHRDSMVLQRKWWRWPLWKAKSLSLNAMPPFRKLLFNSGFAWARRRVG
jgi:hypothetical protein